MRSDKEHRHFVVFKPYGYLSQFIVNGKKKRSQRLLGELYDFPEGTMAVGRLDEASEGLLILTTDGKTSYHYTGGNVEKEYVVQVDGEISDEALEKLQKGVEISIEGEKYMTRPCGVKKLNDTPVLPERARKIRDDRHGPTSWISIVLREGKYRQVRKMTAAVGFPTLRLVRVRIDTITMDKMQAGEVRELKIK